MQEPTASYRFANSFAEQLSGVLVQRFYTATLGRLYLPPMRDCERVEVAKLKMDQIEVKEYVGGLVKSPGGYRDV